MTLPAIGARSAVTLISDKDLRIVSDFSDKRKFPLSIYRRGTFQYWCKKHQHRRIYFERLENDPDGSISLQQWLKVKAGYSVEDARQLGGDNLTLRELANRWLTMQDQQLQLGEIGQRMFGEYRKACELLFDSVDKFRPVLSLSSADFLKIKTDLSKRYGPVTQRKVIIQIRGLLRYASDEELISKPVRFGKAFDPPSAKILRRVRREKGRQDFTREEILSMLEASNTTQRAMILLGINAALGNSDVADLPKSAICDGWMNYHRTKTEIDRRVPLWPETVEAVEAVKRERPAPNTELFFVSARGQTYQDRHRTGWRITGEFRQVLARAGIESNGRGFYGLRRTFQTQAEACGDLVACKSIMGHSHSESDMSARYRQIVEDHRLVNATDTVRRWLFGASTPFSDTCQSG